MMGTFGQLSSVKTVERNSAFWWERQSGFDRGAFDLICVDEVQDSNSGTLAFVADQKELHKAPLVPPLEGAGKG